ncbi:DUF3325 domain-containing protein [Pseudomonas sp. RIT-PI-AD]|uniref:DUF3325 domain-containing protein n=1 Tax=Pseudomonas sp. RIT-PI-AD TaxID=3035294 RepID=UPI0021DB5CB8|nr:DUF3325 domain-containing protein [Pseudomonas sp. RIT-PI-AD]
MILLALSLAYAGYCALCLAMNRHHSDTFGAPPSARRARLLRGIGGLALALSFTLCVMARGAPLGSVLWVGLLVAAGLLLVLLHPYAARLCVGLAIGAPLLSLALLPFA